MQGKEIMIIEDIMAKIMNNGLRNVHNLQIQTLTMKRNSLKLIAAINRTCLVASFLTLSGILTSFKLFINPLITSFWATTNFEVSFPTISRTSSNIQGLENTFSITDFLHLRLGKTYMDFLMDCIIFSKALLTSLSSTSTSNVTTVWQSTFIANLASFSWACFCCCFFFFFWSFNCSLGLGRCIPCLLLVFLELPMDFKHKDKSMVHMVNATWLQCTLL